MQPVRSHPLAVRPQSDALGELGLGAGEDSKLCRGISSGSLNFCILISEEVGDNGEELGPPWKWRFASSILQVERTGGTESWQMWEILYVGICCLLQLQMALG